MSYVIDTIIDRTFLPVIKTKLAQELEAACEKTAQEVIAKVLAEIQYDMSSVKLPDRYGERIELRVSLGWKESA